MEVTINEMYVKVGKLPISKPVPIDSAFQLSIPGEEFVYQLTCVKEEKKTNNDGTVDVTYILKHDG